MSVHEEVEEHVHHAQDPFDKIVAGCMAIIAACLAVVSMLAQHYNTETVFHQQLASDQWAYYQAKDIRRYIALTTQDSLGTLKRDQALVSHYKSEATKYLKQREDIKDKASDLEKERDSDRKLALRFDFGEVLLEIGIVFASLAILTKRRVFFTLAVFTSVAGGIFAVTAYWF